MADIVPPVKVAEKEVKPDKIPEIAKKKMEKPQVVEIRTENIKIDTKNQPSPPPPIDHHDQARNRLMDKIQHNATVEDIILMEEEYLHRNLTLPERQMVAERVQYLQKHRGLYMIDKAMKLLILKFY